MNGNYRFTWFGCENLITGKTNSGKSMKILLAFLMCTDKDLPNLKQWNGCPTCIGDQKRIIQQKILKDLDFCSVLVFNIQTKRKAAIRKFEF
jgi:hypothetical protein